MCLAIPAKVLEIEENYARVDFGGIIKKVLINLLEKVEVGEYVIVHAGYAIEVMSEEEGVKTKLLLEEMITSLD
jgi:hydrogenase expression/formation protein HypC